MYVIQTAAILAVDAVIAVCLSFVGLFIFLAYFEPMTLDMLVHQAHDVIPVAINSVIDFITNLF